jgi:perosamine synthetase
MPEVEASVTRALQSGAWGNYDGPNGAELIDRLASRFSQPLVTLCSSGTVAVELALRGLGVDAGHEVILGGYDFPGNFRAIEAIGAIPVLVDLAADRFAIDVDSIDQAISDKTAAIIVSHLHGSLAPMRSLMKLATTRGLPVLEDACQCPGAAIAGAPAGSFGDAAVLSFGGSKLLTAGRGGAILTREGRVHQRIKVFQDRGNLAFPLSELQAAALIPQMETLNHFHERRLASAKILAQHLQASILSSYAIEGGDDQSPAYYKFPLLLPEQTRESICTAASALGVPLFAGFRGFATRSSKRCRIAGSLVNSQRYAKETALLHHSALLLEESHVVRLAKTLHTLIEEGR